MKERRCRGMEMGKGALKDKALQLYRGEGCDWTVLCVFISIHAFSTVSLH